MNFFFFKQFHNNRRRENKLFPISLNGPCCGLLVQLLLLLFFLLCVCVCSFRFGLCRWFRRRTSTTVPSLFSMYVDVYMLCVELPFEIEGLSLSLPFSYFRSVRFGIFKKKEEGDDGTVFVGGPFKKTKAQLLKRMRKKSRSVRNADWWCLHGFPSFFFLRGFFLLLVRCPPPRQSKTTILWCVCVCSVSPFSVGSHFGSSHGNGICLFTLSFQTSCFILCGCSDSFGLFFILFFFPFSMSSDS